MLSLAKVARGREEYYLASLPREEGAAGLVEAPGTWLGAGAARLELEGAPVTPEGLRELLAGRHPRDGSVLDPGHGRVRVAAFDATFSPPKSVSLLHALGSAGARAATEAAHEEAVRSVLGYLERQAGQVRRSVGGIRQAKPAGGLVAAAFVHVASRAPDPHLHSHLLLANLAADEEGRWSALDARPLFVEARTAGALYEAELRGRLSGALGVAWRRREDGVVDLAGVPHPASRAFSRRSAAIGEELARGGWSSPRAARVAAAATRPEKDRSRSREELEGGWRARAREAGLAGRRWERVAPGPDRPVGGGGGDVARRGLAALERPFTRGELLAAAAGEALAGIEVARLEAEVDRLLAEQGAVRELAPGVRSLRSPAGRALPSGRSERRFTTPRLEAEERRFREALRQAVPLGPEVAFPPAGVVVLGVAAGALQGSSSPLGELRARAEAALSAGRPVRAVAPSEREAAEVGAATGLPAACLGEGALAPLAVAGARGSVTVVGGAEGLAPRTLLRLLEAALAGRGALVLVVGGGQRGRGGPGDRPHGLFGRLLLEAARRSGPPPTYFPPDPGSGRSQAGRERAATLARRRIGAELEGAGSPLARVLAGRAQVLRSGRGWEQGMGR